MQVVRTEMRPFRHIIRFIRRREGGDAHRVGWLADIKQPDQLLAVLLVVEHRFIQHHQQIAIRQRQRGMRSAAERRAPVAMTNQPRLGTVFDIQQRQAAVAPAAVGGIPGNNGVMQRIAFALRPVRCFTARLVHPRQPPAPGHFGLTRIGQIDGQEDVVSKTVDQRGHIRPAAADVPDAVNTDAVKRQETDFPRLRGSGNIKDAQPGAPALVLHIADRVTHRAGVVHLLISKTGVSKQIPGVDHQQQIVMRLEMHVPGARRRGNIVDGGGPGRIANIDHGKTLRHHMADIGESAVHHQLHAVRTTALIAMANQPHIAAVFGGR